MSCFCNLVSLYGAYGLESVWCILKNWSFNYNLLNEKFQNDMIVSHFDMMFFFLSMSFLGKKKDEKNGLNSESYPSLTLNKKHGQDWYIVSTHIFICAHLWLKHMALVSCFIY